MESLIYGIVDTPASSVEVAYFPYPHQIRDGIELVSELPDIVDGIIYKVRIPDYQTDGRPEPQEDYIDIDMLHEKFSKAEFNKHRQLFKEVAQRTSNTDSYENTFDISKDELDQFYDDLSTTTELEVKQLKANLVTVLTHDHASATIEAFVRDGLDVEGFNIDKSLKEHVSNAVYLKYLNSIMERIELPESIMTPYLNVIIEDMKSNIESKRKSGEFKNMIKRYRNELDNPVGVVDDNEHSIGRVRLRSNHGIRKENSA